MAANGAAMRTRPAGSPAAGSSATYDERGPLPEGWKTRMDMTRNKPHGRRMYYNRKLGKTSWHRPKVEEQQSLTQAPDPATVAPAPPTTPYQVAAPTESFLPPITPVPRPRQVSVNPYHDVDEAPIEFGWAGCMPKLFCCCFSAGCVVSLGIFMVMMGVVVEFADQRKAEQIMLLLGSFFGVLAFGSAVFCVLLLVPRYSGHKGIPWIRYKHQEQLLRQENWVWSMVLRGNFIKKLITVAKSIALIFVKASQLFALTYVPAAIDKLPTVVVEVGDFVLLDLEKLAQSGKSGNNTAFASVMTGVGAVGGNDTAAAVGMMTDGYASALEFAGGEDAYRNKFFVWAGVCGFVFLLVAVGQCGGALEGKRGEGCEKAMVGILSGIVEFAFIPLYHHLLQAFDCTRIRPVDAETAAMEANGTIDPEWRWDVDPTQKCFEGDLFGWLSTEDMKPPHLFFFAIGMGAICLMQWPTTYFLMIRPDTYSDDKRQEIEERIRESKKWMEQMQALGITPAPVGKAGRALKQQQDQATGGHRNWFRAEQKTPEEDEVSKRLHLPALQLRKRAEELYLIPKADIDNIDSQGCCTSVPDSQAEGISAINRRPREIPIAFCLEATITTVSVLLSSDGFSTADGDFIPQIYEADTLKLKLFVLGSTFTLLALFFCNPFTLLCGKVTCSPYGDSAGTLHRTNLWQMGYPYNWEPLNFFRAAAMGVCASFAFFELLSFNHKFPSDDTKGFHMPNTLAVHPDDAMDLWYLSCGGIGAFYALCLVFRYCIYWRDTSKNKKKQEEREKTRSSDTQP